MSITDPPTVVINGVTTVPEWDYAGTIALAGLTITWGRDGLYDEATPAQLKLSIIDIDGSWASADDLVGKPVQVIRGDGITIFRGRLTDHDATPLTLTDPDFGMPRRVWQLELSASCKLAELAQAVLPGPGNVPADVEAYGPNYWSTQSPTARLADIMTQGAADIVAGIQWVAPYAAGGWYPLTRYRKFADRKSALDLIEALYNAAPLVHANYNPHTNTVEMGKPADTDGLDLEWDGDTLTLDVDGGLTIPANTIVVPGDYTAATSIDKAIDVVQVTVPNLGPSTSYEIVDATTEARAARFDPTARGRRVLSVTNDVFYNAGTGPDAWQTHLANDTRDYVNDVNGRLTLPTLRFDFKRFDYAPAVAALALLTYDKPTPLYFEGSIFNTLLAAGAAHQIIAGTLVFDGHWSADVTVAPAVGYGVGLMVNQLVTIDAPTMADYDDDITLADLGNVTTGVTA